MRAMSAPPAPQRVPLAVLPVALQLVVVVVQLLVQVPLRALVHAPVKGSSQAWQRQHRQPVMQKARARARS